MALRVGTWLGLMVAIGFGGCHTESEGVDADRDGWTVEQGDCDDGDAQINPHAREIPCDGVDQDCNGEDQLDLYLDEVRPEMDAEDVYYRIQMIVDIGEPRPRGEEEHLDATMTLTDDGGQIVRTELVHRQAWDLRFDLETPLTPSTAYTASLAVKGCAPTEWPFTTSEVGAPVPPLAAEGGDFLIDFGTGEAQEPPGIGGILSQYIVDLHLVVHIADLDDDLGTALAYSTVVDQDGSDYIQDLCVPTSSWSGEDGDVTWDNPHFETAPFSLPFLAGSITGVDAVGWIHDVVVTGDLAPDGQAMAGLVFDATMDTRFMDKMIDPQAEEGAICDLTASLGINCIECPDEQGPFCLDILIDLVNAERVDVEGVHPETHELLDTLYEVTPDQIEAWQASGDCP